MKIILLTLLVLYALAMLGASLYGRRPGLAWLTGLNVFCALSLIAASLATCLGWLAHGPACLGARTCLAQPHGLRPTQRLLSIRPHPSTSSPHSWRLISNPLASLLAKLSKRADLRGPALLFGLNLASPAIYRRSCHCG